LSRVNSRSPGASPKEEKVTNASGVLPRRSGRFTGTSLAGLIVVLAAGVGFAILIALVRAQWRPMESLDHGLAASLNRSVADNGALVTALKMVTTLGSYSILIGVVLIGVVVLLLRRLSRLALYLVVTGTGSIIMDPTLKAAVGRLRPVVAEPIATGGGNSFPSGHALGSIVVYGALLLVLLPGIPRRARPWVSALLGLLVVAIGFSRLALGVHFLSDVIGAWLLGVAWLGVTGYAFQLWRRHTGRRDSHPLHEGLEPEAKQDLEAAAPERESAPQLGRAAAGTAVAWVFIFGVLVGVGMLLGRYHGGNGNILGDATTTHWLAAHRTRTLDSISFFFSEAGNSHWILDVGLVAGPVALAVIRRWRPIIFLVVAMLGELSLFLASAAIVGRPRPDVSHLDERLPTSSFPSGHVAATICLYGGIALLVMPRTQRWWRWLFLAAAIAMPVLVALSRMYRGMHHPTDVLGSLLLAMCWVSAVALAVRPNCDLGERDICARAPHNVRELFRYGGQQRIPAVSQPGHAGHQGQS
jgi:undecaprenyl-diphosphatase